MGKLLYVKASPMQDMSYSMAVADAFVETYSRRRPDDGIDVLDLFTEPLPDFDFAAASAKYKIMHDREHSTEDKEVWSKIVAVIERFVAAEKYVFAVPMWNFSIPYRLKQYIDIIVQPGFTFAFSQAGYQGLAGPKPVFVAYARGGEYKGQAQAVDFQKKYFEHLLGFIGFKDIRSVVVEPTLAGGQEIAKQRVQEAIDKARLIAADF
ncbi:MAG: NAD(P)H-dependent oxidoreductase [Sedimentisphaerales bacterium]|nr:NAD(P)H-dependent oxidoreductase [Sedimentisphaerales bacterium]